MKIYGEGQKILGVGLNNYEINENQWQYELTREMNYNSALGKHNQYFDEAQKKFFPKTQTMIDEEIKLKEAERIYEEQKEAEKLQEIENIKSTL